MPLKNGALTPGERAVAAAMAATGSQSYARAETRMSQAHISKMVARPAVQAEIARIQTERLFSEALPAAVDCLLSIIRSEKAAAGARVQASKIVLDRTLGSEESGKTKEPSEMTPDELAKAIEEGEASLRRMITAASDRAKPVDNHSQQDEPSGSIFE